MPGSNKQILIASFIVILLLNACLAPGTGTIPAAESHTPSNPTPLASPSLSPTQTHQPTATQTPETISQPTSTLISTATTSPTPATLAPDEKQAFVLDMLNTNAGCELPCWWGIEPGETSWQDLQAHFAASGIQISEGGYLDLGYYEADETTHVPMMEVLFQEMDGVVQSVYAASNAYFEPFQREFPLVWGQFELSRLLAQHGVPSQVYLSMEVGAGCIGPGIVHAYSMWVVYDELGIAVYYPGLLIRDLNEWLICPLFGQNKTIEIHLQTPGSPEPLVNITTGGDDFYYTGTLEELTGLSQEDFYERFKQADTQACMIAAEPMPFVYEEILPPMPRAALTPAEEDDLLVEKLATNENCKLPCWWGITPGETSLQTALDTFQSFGKSIGVRQHVIDVPPEFEGEIAEPIITAYDVSPFGRHAQYPFDYLAATTLFEEDGTLVLIGVLGHALGGSSWFTSEWPRPNYFADDWERYSLSQVLERFGQPSQVLLHYWPHEGALYSLALLYEDLGVMVAYMGAVQADGGEGDNYQLDTPLICPNPENINDINLWMKAPGLDNSLEEIFNNWEAGEGYYTIPFNPTRSATLEQATGMSLDSFYQTYREPDATTCLQTSIEAADYLP